MFRIRTDVRLFTSTTSTTAYKHSQKCGAAWKPFNFPNRTSTHEICQKTQKKVVKNYLHNKQVNQIRTYFSNYVRHTPLIMMSQKHTYYENSYFLQCALFEGETADNSSKKIENHLRIYKFCDDFEALTYRIGG